MDGAEIEIEPPGAPLTNRINCNQTPNTVAKIFISHASEDKAKFVKPLAIELKKHHEIWYDEYALKIGDSLREKIDEGLRNCDFGVVVLSKPFFAKNWTQNELGALFALEKRHRKLILPVWHEITKEDLTIYSPMLADKLAANSSHGVAIVVEQILQAIEASERTTEVANNHGRSRLIAFNKTLAEKEHQTKLFRTSRGYELLRDEIKKIEELIASEISEISKQTGQGRFKIGKLDDNSNKQVLHAPRSVSMILATRDVYTNSIDEAKLVFIAYHRGMFTNSPMPSSVIKEVIYLPQCREGEMINWIQENDEKKSFTTQELSQTMLFDFAGFVEAHDNNSPWA